MWRGSSKCWLWSIALGSVAACGGRVELLVEPPGGDAGSGASAGRLIVGAGGVLEAAGNPSVGGAGPIVAGSAGRASAGSAGLGEGGSSGEGGTTGEAGVAGLDAEAGAAGEGSLLAPDRIETGAFSTCARFLDGSLRCWGANSSGQLGDGSFVDSAAPVRVKLSRRPSSFSLGDDFGCAVMDDGSARCWGANHRGQLGNGSSMFSSIPLLVRHFDSQNNPALIVVSGRASTCALTISGAVQCWGANDVGQLGNGTLVDSPEPSSAVLGTPSTSGTNLLLGAGADHSCLLLGNHVRCWGANFAGQLGDGTQTNAPNPVDAVLDPVPSPGVAWLALGGALSCVVDGTSGIRCWGRDGASSMLAATSVPFPAGTKSVLRVDAGDQHACGYFDDGHVYCWGAAEPIGQASSSSIPMQIMGLPEGEPIDAISAGGAHSCALMRSGSIYCWGDNRFGQLGVTGVSYSAKALRAQAWD